MLTAEIISWKVNVMVQFNDSYFTGNAQRIVQLMKLLVLLVIICMSLVL